MEKVARHEFISTSTGRPQFAISFHRAAARKHKMSNTTPAESLIGQTSAAIKRAKRDRWVHTVW
jgi:hypothetical protein